MRSSRIVKAKEIEERAKLAELQAKMEFIKQRQKKQNEAVVLKVKEEIAGTKAKMEI